MNSGGRRQGAGGRGQPAVSNVEPGAACGEQRRTGGGDSFRRSTFRLSTFRQRNRRGMTLVEVILGAAILGVLAVAVITALFYPRYLVVTSAIEQSAIHAGSSEIEGYLRHYTNSATQCQFGMSGWIIGAANITTTTNIIPDPAYNTCHYVEIKTSVAYRDGKTVDLVTYRSLEVLNSSR